MAFDSGFNVDVTVLAGADISGSQYKFLEITSDEVTVANASGEKALGVLQNKPDAQGKPAQVRVLGISKIQSDEALAVGDLIATSADGQAKKVAAAASGTGHTNTSDTGSATDALLGAFVMGIVLQASGAAGELATAFIFPMGAVPTTAV